MATPLIAKPNDDAKFAPPPAKSLPGVILATIGQGTSTREYDGELKESEGLCIVYEVEGKDQATGLPRRWLMAQRYSISLHEKAPLRHLVDALLGGAGDGLDVHQLAGKGALVSVVHKESKNGRTYGKVAGAIALPDGMAPIVPSHPVLTWSPGDPWEVLEAATWLPRLYGEKIIDSISV